MEAVIENDRILLDCAFDMVDGEVPVQDIVFRDEDDVGFRQLLVIVADEQGVGIHDAAVVPGTSGPGSLVGALHLDIVFAEPVIGVDIEPHAASLQVLDGVLRDDFPDFEGRLIHDDAEREFRAAVIALEGGRHEIIIEQPEIREPFQILLMFNPFFLVRHACPFFLPLLYYIIQTSARYKKTF